jgi:hypothetical protein
MNAIRSKAIIVLVCVGSLMGRVEACEPPEVWINDWLHYIGVGESITVTANEYSGTEITDWQWSYSPSSGISILDEDDWYGWYPTSSREILFETTGAWYIEAEATNVDQLTDYDYARVYVCDVTITYADRHAAYNGGVAHIYYTVEPTSGSFRYDIDLYIKDGSGNTVHTADLTSLGLGSNNTIWDGTDDFGQPVPPGDYMATVQLRVAYDPVYFSDSCTISVVDLKILQPDEGQQFCFASATPGTLSISAAGTTGVSSLDTNSNDLKWTLTGRTAQYGATTVFTYDDMPMVNSELGSKTLTLTYVPAGFQVSQTIELFFPKTATNNSYGWMNWGYYWQSGPAAVPDLAGFSYESGQDYMGQYFATTDSLVVYDAAAEQIDANSCTLYNHFYNVRINSGEDGYPSTTAPADDDTNGQYPYWDNGVKVIGPPDAIAITDGGDNIIDTAYSGDDWVDDLPGGGKVLRVGPDGKLTGGTTKSPSDAWYWYEYMGKDYHILPMGGVPFTPSIGPGTNKWLETACQGDDGVHLPDALSVTWSQPDANGIDTCAIVCKHEREHQARFAQVRDPGSAYPNYTYDPTNDGDYVDDAWEQASGYHLYANSDDTYNLVESYLGENAPAGWIPDNEFCAYMAEMTPGSVYPAYDWSDTDGRNWDGGNP